MLQLALPDAAATRRFGLILGRSLPAGSILLLQGDLGSGKTTLVQSIGEGLGISEAIVSPTFTLIHEYLEGRVPLYHLDLYRLNPAEVNSLHLETYWEGQEVPPGIVAIEWPERLTHWPQDSLKIHLEAQPGDRGRIAEITPVGHFNLEPLGLENFGP